MAPFYHHVDGEELLVALTFLNPRGCGCNPESWRGTCEAAWSAAQLSNEDASAKSRRYGGAGRQNNSSSQVSSPEPSPLLDLQALLVSTRIVYILVMIRFIMWIVRSCLRY